jgi:hypothetical protein
MRVDEIRWSRNTDSQPYWEWAKLDLAGVPVVVWRATGNNFNHAPGTLWVSPNDRGCRLDGYITDPGEVALIIRAATQPHP